MCEDENTNETKYQLFLGLYEAYKEDKLGLGDLKEFSEQLNRFLEYCNVKVEPTMSLSEKVQLFEENKDKLKYYFDLVKPTVHIILQPEDKVAKRKMIIDRIEVTLDEYDQVAEIKVYDLKVNQLLQYAIQNFVNWIRKTIR